MTAKLLVEGLLQEIASNIDSDYLQYDSAQEEGLIVLTVPPALGLVVSKAFQINGIKPDQEGEDTEGYSFVMPDTATAAKAHEVLCAMGDAFAQAAEEHVEEEPDGKKPKKKKK